MDLKTKYKKPDIYPLYEKRYSEQMIKNIAQVKKEINKKWMLKKIESHAKKFSYTKEKIKNDILANDTAAAFFAKDPAKQKVHENTAAEFIKDLPFISNFEQLPTNNKEKTLFCKNGKIIKKKDKIDSDSKSIDFHWQYIFNGKILNFYASHKFTNEEGGSQDNQFKDVVLFNKEAVKCADDNTYLLAIVDGCYYMEAYNKDASFTGTKLKYLQDKTSGTRNNTTTSNELLKTIIPVIMHWLEKNFDASEYSAELQTLKHVLKSYN